MTKFVEKKLSSNSDPLFNLQLIVEKKNFPKKIQFVGKKKTQ
jgi:hypothetical protein